MLVGTHDNLDNAIEENVLRPGAAEVSREQGDECRRIDCSGFDDHDECRGRAVIA